MDSMGRYLSSMTKRRVSVQKLLKVFSPTFPNEPSPLGFIANGTCDLTALKRAQSKAQFGFLSDWHHLTSSKYPDVETTSGLDLFCVDSLLINGNEL